MARKLRFFREQMVKVGLSSSMRSIRSSDVDLDHLEVVRSLNRYSGIDIFLMI